MSFLFRALIVIGALTYFAAGRTPKATHAETASAASAGVSTLTAAWNTLPVADREPLVRAAAGELGRQLAATALSRDTLAAADRRPAWRGAAAE